MLYRAFNLEKCLHASKIILFLLSSSGIIIFVNHVAFQIKQYFHSIFLFPCESAQTYLKLAYQNKGANSVEGSLLLTPWEGPC